MSLSFHVTRPGWTGRVLVGLSLGGRTDPILEPRILFHGRSLNWHGERDRLGKVSGGGQHWDLEERDIEEIWQDAKGRHTRHRLRIIDPNLPIEVGVLYWVETRPPG